MKKLLYAITYKDGDCVPPLVGAPSLQDAATTAVEVCRTADGEPIPDGEGNLGVEAPGGSITYYRVDRPRAIPVGRYGQYGQRLAVPAPRWRFWVICGFGPAGSGKPARSAAAAWRAWRRGASEADRNATTARCYRAETWRAAEDADISAAAGVAPDGGRWEGCE